MGRCSAATGSVAIKPADPVTREWHRAGLRPGASPRQRAAAHVSPVRRARATDARPKQASARYAPLVRVEATRGPVRALGRQVASSAQLCWRTRAARWIEQLGATLGVRPEPSLGVRDRAAESTARISDSSPLPGLTCRRMGGIATLRSWEVQRNRCRFHSASICDRERPSVETCEQAKSWWSDGDCSQRTTARGRTNPADECPRVEHLSGERDSLASRCEHGP